MAAKNHLPDPEILLERGAVMVLAKPGGLLTQGPPGIDSLELRTKQFLIRREQKPGKAYLGVPHRLDRPVSGAMVVTKNVRAAKRISEQLQNRTVTKTYWAVIEPQIDEATGVWEDFMRKLPDEPRSEIVAADHPDAKKAILSYRRLASGNNRSLVEIELQTGRTHQIRLQFGSRGYPVLGDELYGAVTPFGPQTDDQRKRWIALHARQLGFEHPIDHQRIEVVAPLPDYWNVFSQLIAERCGD
jgi:23S rRNA pseudouridine1911/1915/1917 synthase